MQEGVILHGFREVCDLGGRSSVAAVPPSTADPAIIMYTSGSTGVPKGVVLPHEALVTTVKAFHFVVQVRREEYFDTAEIGSFVYSTYRRLCRKIMKLTTSL